MTTHQLDSSTRAKTQYQSLESENLLGLVINHQDMSYVPNNFLTSFLF